jgi:hypothetical protein
LTHEAALGGHRMQLQVDAHWSVMIRG